MKYLTLVLVFLLFSCNEFKNGNNSEMDVITSETPINSKTKTGIPEGALRADFIGNRDSVYAFIKEIDTSTKTTLISFEKDKLPEISIPESLGAHLKILKLKNFDQDNLLVNAISLDTNFNEYHLFVWKDSMWNQPVNRFYIHKSNMSDTLIPIKDNPKDSMQVIRYYSVFEMDQTSEKKYSWRLEQESVLIEE
ncbi:hypothetical protein [Aequorivita capsosiphonis]|uniref:hypothetical protein n=1 Tax=Aequorivita capsosiphonis TaxID=487317 RepID=UPI000425A3C2|nr:hypothetical protein [Aequorivita capsosiphonis]